MFHRLFRRKSKELPTEQKGQQQQQRQQQQTQSETAKNVQERQQQPLQSNVKASANAIPATASGSLQINLQNQSSSSSMYAYITGSAIDRNNAVFLLRSDGRTPYYPSSPKSTGSPLGADCAIPLGAPGNTVQAVIPRLAGGRIWFSVDQKLTFLLNPGPNGGSPGLVEPSIFNQADPNINIQFGFCEFTFNQAELFANISYVDFVSGVPIALTLTETSGKQLHIGGMGPDGLNQVCQGLEAQSAKDGRRWKELIVRRNGQNLRALSPNSGILLHPDWFETYWTDYVNQVYSKFDTQPLTVNTQASYGNVQGDVNAQVLTFPNGVTFAKPSARDIFSCSTGPFATSANTPEKNAIIPRLSAAFNRSTLLLTNEIPNGTSANEYYTNPTTNHYSRIVHAANVDGLGYAFPYDDVTPDGGVPQEGAVNSFTPALWTVTVGGRNAYKG
ncbi:glycoside hydrolase family 64 protein [Polychaeton citri CBS 116435]|uniref:Glycoside hydrolase family 64 protein n=1 Tax=Polychaeton citri CBS 116435 TaxID=1314669 RepID=A0A9P4Q0L2_9PEZI|nr:glycoside hydrolase family 64 protein [Polychaeton citri CBS 116435]